MAQVVLENVSKVYPGGVKAVDGVDLVVGDGEFIVLVGPSGCGKTTSLRMVAGLEEITSGAIRIGDRVVNHVAPKDRDIAMVFQNYALYPHMTVFKNMAFGLMLRRRHKAWDHPLSRVLAPGRFREARAEREGIERRVRETASMLGIVNLLERRPKELSGGQRQRVAVGRAIVREPKAFLFDEPLSNLDAKLRVEMRAELKRLHRQLGTTTLYVTHDQEEAMTLGDRIVVMKDGTVQQCATPLEVYERPSNRFVAGFVGTPPMNFMNGRLTRSGGRMICETPGGPLAVDPRHESRLGPHIEKPVILGLRPELLTLKNGAAAASSGLRATIEVFEPLGDRMDVHASLADGQRVVCRMDANPSIREGEKIELSVAMVRAHYFDADDSGRNLLLV